jgi:hypothetical protein
MKTEAKRNGLICSNCDSGNMTLCLDFGDEEPAEGVSISYRCEECGEVHFVCKIYSNAFQPGGLDGLHVAENKPLTLDELRRFDGEPVYLQFGDGGQGWAIACDEGEWFSFYGIDFEDERPEMAFLNMEHQDPAGHYGLHVLGWRAYRSKPVKEGEHEIPELG